MPSKKLAAFFLFALLLPAFAGAEVYFDAPPRENWYRCPLLRLTAFDTDQSDCLLLQCGGEAMMVDGGTAEFGGELADALTRMGIANFRHLLNTHDHSDHIGGLCELMRRGFSAEAYLHPYPEASARIRPLLREALDLADASGIPAEQVFSGDTLLLGEAVLTLLRYDEGLSTNGRSLMVHVRFGDATLLLTADIIGDTQSWFVRHLPEELLHSDVLKAPHHGVTAVLSAFWQAVSPEALLVTNTPDRAPDTAAQAERGGVPAFFSGLGRVVMETDGEDWYIYQQNGAF